jgi:Recombinase
MKKKKTGPGRRHGSHELDEEIRRLIAKEYKKGKSLLQIVQMLEIEEIPTARGGDWHQSTIRAILHQMKISTTKIVIPDNIIKIILDLHTKGKNNAQISRILEDKKYKNTKGKVCWYTSTVARILLRETGK